MQVGWIQELARSAVGNNELGSLLCLPSYKPKNPIHHKRLSLFSTSFTDMTQPLYLQMMAAEAIAMKGINDIEEADLAMRRADILAVRFFLFPNGKPPQPWRIAEYGFWQQLTREAEIVEEALARCTVTNGEGEAEASPAGTPPEVAYHCPLPDDVPYDPANDYSREVPTAEERSPSLRGQ